MSFRVINPGSFYHYLSEYVLDKDNAKGDLARDMVQEVSSGWLTDPEWIDSLDKLLFHLEYNGACDECLRAARQCWRDYMHELRKWQMMQSIEEGSPPPEPYQWDGEYSRRRK